MARTTRNTEHVALVAAGGLHACVRMRMHAPAVSCIRPIHGIDRQRLWTGIDVHACVFANMHNIPPHLPHSFHALSPIPFPCPTPTCPTWRPTHTTFSL